MLLWFLLTAAAVLFVVVDIRSTPESPVLKFVAVGGGEAPRPPVPVMALVSLLALAAGVATAFLL